MTAPYVVRFTFYSLRFTSLKGANPRRDTRQETDRVVPFTSGMAKAVDSSRVVGGVVGVGPYLGLQVWVVPIK